MYFVHCLQRPVFSILSPRPHEAVAVPCKCPLLLLHRLRRPDHFLHLFHFHFVRLPLSHFVLSPTYRLLFALADPDLLSRLGCLPVLHPVCLPSSFLSSSFRLNPPAF